MPDLVNSSHYVWAGTVSEYPFCEIDTIELVKRIKNKISQGCTSIIFDTMYEGFYPDIVKKLHRIINLVDCPEVTYHYVTAALNGKEAYQLHCDRNGVNPCLNMISMSTFEMTSKGHLDHYYVTNNEPHVKYTPGIKDKLFVCFNKICRKHRTLIFHRILTGNLLERSYTSFEPGLDVIQRLSRYGDPGRMLPVFKQYKNIFPLKLNMPKGRHNPIDVRKEDIAYHETSYFSLVTETVFFRDDFDSGDSIFLTEKTFRPIHFKHPFILLSSAGSLEYLRKLGYKTFHPFINESYDLEMDDNRRFEKVWKEVLRLCSFSEGEWLGWQKEIAPILEHNYNVFWNKNNYVLS